jgi:glycosyltransferase involved in cell wall biosynthesis
MDSFSTKSSPLVSVMIITYNQDNYIKETLNSVLNQEYSNLQIVVADDASTDSTHSILMEYKRKFPNTVEVVFNEKNLGITGNCNAGLALCTGKYIAVLGGDDIFLPGKLIKQVSLMESDEKITISYHAVEIFQSQTNEILFVTNQSKIDTPITLHELLVCCIPGSSSVMVRKTMMPSYGFEPSLPTVSDWLFNIELATRGKIAFLPDVLGRYRKHGKQASFRTLELLDESLSNLSIAAKRFPELCPPEIISKGKARYLQGEAYRRLMLGDGKTARNLVFRAIREHFDIKSCILFVFSLIPISPNYFIKMKFILKKIF